MISLGRPEEETIVELLPREEVELAKREEDGPDLSWGCPFCFVFCIYFHCRSYVFPLSFALFYSPPLV